MRKMRPPSDPPLVCHTPYTIRNGNLVYRPIACAVGARARTSATISAERRPCTPIPQSRASERKSAARAADDSARSQTTRPYVTPAAPVGVRWGVSGWGYQYVYSLHKYIYIAADDSARSQTTRPYVTPAAPVWGVTLYL